ncbi:hypothetical protein CONCODRAFT_8290 [Conidiobolus coronatus NRRL 28638]|uniref:Uncharacterized protein n=1 Tax=Conidiobolus coronatus (strain ATCC 28846 / CBS 209.66 / NRRL 28638) TaxID=796925 RepID=A0A137P2S0_CONC2|nr:hypothetical protein CONCODRAFT_8290 [Conidiobolus coronatus NRRL 28638]|eukprot:KXN69327.1 hypothetical protein CONCODRAFT_8290 [Conidiobolus coronatus NRRL 28638]
MPNQRMKSSLRPISIANKEKDSEAKESSITLPTYSIELTAASCTLLLFAILFFIYVKNKQIKSSSLNHKPKRIGLMQIVWAKTDATNVENFYKLDKLKGLYNNVTRTGRNSFATRLFSNMIDKVESY